MVVGPSTVDHLVAQECGDDLSGGTSRRNLVTRGLRLSELNGRFFRIGGVLLHVARECAPRKHLERLVPGSFAALNGRGGLRAEIIAEGLIRTGDDIQPRK